jgi:4'-phosphopantetheinyl transferase
MATSGSVFELGECDVHVWVLPLEHPDRKRRRELAHLAQRRLLSRYLGVEEEAVEIVTGDYGKPRVNGDRVRFNLSHSGAWAMLAVSGGLEVGIDLQGPHPAASKRWFADRICTDRERAALGAAPEPSALLRLWTRKEAVIKARGDLSYVSAGEVDVLEDAVAGGWRCTDLPFTWAPDHHAAVALPRRPGASLALRGLWPGR